MATYTNLSSVSTDGVVESTTQGVLLGSFATMPTASASNAGCIVLYTGATVGNYTQDRFYQCVNNSGTYSWVQITVADTPSLSGYVPTSRKVAGHPLTADVSISASDVGAVPTSRKVNGNALTSDVTITLASLGGVPDTRKVNNKALSSDISLGASDVSAIPSSYLSTSKPTSSSTDTEVPSSKAVYSAVNEVSTAVSNEASARSGADNSLQSQIDALVAKSDVVDIVGTYADLQAYPTSGLGNNDIVKVLSDSTHSNMTTYYRWSTSTSAWTYIGGEGPYLTTSSAQSTYVPKTTTINSKALSGNITLGASDVSAIPSSYLNTAVPSSSSTDSQVPTSKAVYTSINNVDSKFSDYALKTNLTDGSVTKVGTNTIGGAGQPIYLNSGAPTGCTVDSAVTQDSTNLVTSGAVYTAINNASGTVVKISNYSTLISYLDTAPLGAMIYGGRLYNSNKATYAFFLFRVPDSGSSSYSKNWIGTGRTVGDFSVTATLSAYYMSGWKIRYITQNADTSQDISSSITLEEVYVKY